jgi:hypothetical protein
MPRSWRAITGPMMRRGFQTKALRHCGTWFGHGRQPSRISCGDDLETLPQAGEHIAEVACVTNHEEVGERVQAEGPRPHLSTRNVLPSSFAVDSYTRFSLIMFCFGSIVGWPFDLRAFRTLTVQISEPGENIRNVR